MPLILFQCSVIDFSLTMFSYVCNVQNPKKDILLSKDGAPLFAA